MVRRLLVAPIAPPALSAKLPSNVLPLTDRVAPNTATTAAILPAALQPLIVVSSSATLAPPLMLSTEPARPPSRPARLEPTIETLPPLIASSAVGAASTVAVTPAQQCHGKWAAAMTADREIGVHADTVHHYQCSRFAAAEVQPSMQPSAGAAGTLK